MITVSISQKGTIVEKLQEEIAKDSQHLRHLISICEGNYRVLSKKKKWIVIITLMAFQMIAEQRQVGETALNDTSSRSHQIIRLVYILFALGHSKKKHGE